ncbi:TonB-dependent receptor domain-containing protein, partial [candidate division KSB1 bacterium]
MNKSMVVGSANIFCLVFLVLSQPVYSQSAALSGRVTNSRTGDPLIGANIVLTLPVIGARPIGAASGENGVYELRNIQPGTYTIMASFVGYETRLYENIAFSPGQRRRLNISLTPTVLETEPVEVSAFRRTMNTLESTSSISVVDTTQLQAIQPMSPADHVAGLAGVDVVKTGINKSNVAVRGFNDISSGSLLMLIDNRIGRVPSLRFNAMNFIPTSNEDIERIEIIRGPVSALYGPNSAQGLMHIVTKSPFGSEGYILNFGLGEHNIFSTDFRYAGSRNNKIGYKITGSFIQGDDFESRDAFEDSTRARILETDLLYLNAHMENPNPPGENVTRIGVRDYLFEKIASTARIDYRVNDNMTFILNGGYNSSTNLELTKIGAAQVDNWKYAYGQAQMVYKELFMQAFFNGSNSGTTYLTRDGEFLIDKSRFFAYQAQNTYQLGDRQKWTYGFDALFTRPVTTGTINGVFEEDDNIDEYGAYVHSDTDISDRMKFVLAGRFDYNSRLVDAFISPSAGIVFNPDLNNTMRLTFNRAFTTPTAENLFLDRIVSPVSDQYQPYNLRVSGVPESGFTFRRDVDGGVGGL